MKYTRYNCPECGSNNLYFKGECEFDRYGKRVQMNHIDIYECSSCKNVVVEHYHINSSTGDCSLISRYPNENTLTNFDNRIKSISKNFVKIYNESETAENNKLFNICGPGYRKALEFLIKDYAIRNNPYKKENIEKKPLGACISEYVQDEKIKEIAKRAAWIGNDETHYIREWENKGIRDLKDFIKRVVSLIENEFYCEKIKLEMPKKNN